MSAHVLITGVDSAGRSCVAQHYPITVQEAPGPRFGRDGFSYSVLYAAPSSPSISSAGGRLTDSYDLGVAAGAMRWTVVDYAPGAAFPMHHTDTVDLDVVLSGSVELTLGDGAHQLAAGDSVVVTGIDHAWRAGPEGCRLSVLCIGAPSP